jgi:lipoprotein
MFVREYYIFSALIQSCTQVLHKCPCSNAGDALLPRLSYGTGFLTQSISQTALRIFQRYLFWLHLAVFHVRRLFDINAIVLNRPGEIHSKNRQLFGVRHCEYLKRRSHYFPLRIDYLIILSHLKILFYHFEGRVDP